MRPDRLFLDGLCSHDVDDETCDQTTQIEAAVEPVGEASKVVLGVLAGTRHERFSTCGLGYPVRSEIFRRGCSA